MQSIYEYLTFTTKIEHDLEHDLTPKKGSSQKVVGFAY
jgi:hypothetical protein